MHMAGPRQKAAASGSPASDPPSYELAARSGQPLDAGNEEAAAAAAAQSKGKKQKKERPWKQQNLPYFFPILTPTIVATPLAIIALAFIPVGAYLYHANNSIGEITFDYTHCSSAAPPTFAAPAPGTQSTRIAQWQYDSSTSTCSMLIDIGWDLPPPVFMYISLTQFYQNHRLYIKSHSTEQTGGKLFLTAADITGECSWLRYANCDTARNVGTWTGSGNMADMNPDCRTPEANRDAVVKNAAPDAQYFPCGLIANSVFSDDISPLQSGTTNYTLPPKDISWPEDLENYANSPWFTDPSLATSIPTKLIPPPGWRHKYPNGYTATEYPNFATDERLQVWLRKAGFPHFRKLWGKNPDATLPKGVYRVDVVDRFQVRSFGGTKSIILSTLGPLGSRDGFLGITFLVVGCIAAFAAFLVWAVRFRKLGDRSYLSWNAKNQ